MSVRITKAESLELLFGITEALLSERVSIHDLEAILQDLGRVHNGLVSEAEGAYTDEGDPKEDWELK